MFENIKRFLKLKIEKQKVSQITPIYGILRGIQK
jgi:hypothetical protein